MQPTSLCLKYYFELTDLHIFEGFNSIAIIINIEVHIAPSVSSWSLFKLAPASFSMTPAVLHNLVGFDSFLAIRCDKML